MAPFVFLTRPAPARIVAADLTRRTGRTYGYSCGRDAHRRGGATLLRFGPTARPVRAVELGRPALGDVPHQRRSGRRGSVALDLDAVDGGDDVGLDPVAQLVEHLESLVFVLDQRVALAVCPQADALAEVLHLRQVLHPLPVDRAQHDVALDHRHEVGPNLFYLAVVSLGRRRVEVLDQPIGAFVQRLVGNLAAGRDGKVRGEVLDQAFQVPVLGVPADAMLLDALCHDLADVAEDVLARIRALEDLAALLVHDLALLVHHVVVFDDVLAGVEVHALDLLLRARNRARDPWMIDWLDLEARHQPADAVRRRAEDLHEVVLEGDEELARAGVTLAAGTTAELVVDAPALVALGADDVQAARFLHAGAEHDVGASTGHVGGDGDGLGLSGLGDDGGLALVLLGVEEVVLQAPPFEHLRKALRLLDRHGADQHRPSGPVHLHDLIDHGFELRLLGLVDDVRVVAADHRPVGRDDDDVERVDLVELLGLGERGARHARELLVLSEVVLDGD